MPPELDLVLIATGALALGALVAIVLRHGPGKAKVEPPGEDDPPQNVGADPGRRPGRDPQS